ncbi:hypothetical protein QVD17_31461 [Tagetes erecta]|uniref:PWWP domain-containing protein n=1 Tax=Tagetes erecta TaxID=13708 RepID=A0AAD8K720_TARER|nr:hypothetical protein QVD17_31461 [Tagetes erecta]
MVDVVSGDMVVDEVGVSKVDLGSEKETGTGDCVMEDVGDEVGESRVERLDKVEVVEGSVEVVKEVVDEKVVTTVVSGSGCDDQKSDSKMDLEPCEEVEVKSGGGEIEEKEFVQELVDEKTRKETEVLNSSNIPKSTEDNVGYDKGEDGADNQGSSNEVVNAGACEDKVDLGTKNTGNEAEVCQTKKESFQSTTEGTTSESQKSETGIQVDESKTVVELDRGATEEKVEQPTESVKEAADGEKTEKDEILDSEKLPDSVTKVDEVITKERLVGKDETQGDASEDQSSLCSDKPSLPTETVNTETREGAAVHENVVNLEQNAEAEQTDKEESSQSAVEVGTHDASKCEEATEVGDSKMDDEPEIIKGEIDVNSVQEVADEEHDSSKVPQSSIMSSLGLEDVDVVAVDEGVEGKIEAQDCVTVQPNLVNPDNESKSTEVVKVETAGVDQKAEADSTSKDENSFGTIKPEDVDAHGKVDEVTVAQKEPNFDVQVSTDGGILVENQSIDVSTVADVSKPDVVADTEPEPSIDKMAPDVTNEVVETATGLQTCKVEPPSIVSESSDIQVDQGLTDNHSNPGDEVTASQIKVPDSTIERGVLPASSEFSYEEAHMERAEDAGMDIDEVLGWKDEMPSAQENEQKVDPTNLPNVDGQETEALEHTLDSEQRNKTSVSLQQSGYFHPPENEGEFSVSDLVWGKVRSHPWWPGQIFDPSDASEKAMKYHKKDCFLVAYFGDRTFGWNDSTVLKPFRENFSQVVEHMNSEAFNNAVHCALEEVSRRVELGLACSCIPQDIYENIKYQIVENSGIKQESSRRDGVDKSASVSSFEPGMLVDYVRLLAKSPYDGDEMELTMAKAQLSSYGRFKGHRQLAEFQLCGDLLEAEQVVKDETYSEDGSKKRKALDSVSDGSEKRPALQTDTATPKPSFKVGESIQKVASQLTGPPEQGNQADLLSQLHLAAQDPMKGLNSSNDAKKRKSLNENESEDFEFDDVNDSYWTDRIIQNYPEENPLQENQNGGGQHQVVAYEQEKQVVKPARRSNKKRFFSSNHEIEAKEQSELIERRRKNLATEVLMKFTEVVLQSSTSLVPSM